MMHLSTIQTIFEQTIKTIRETNPGAVMTFCTRVCESATNSPRAQIPLTSKHFIFHSAQNLVVSLRAHWQAAGEMCHGHPLFVLFSLWENILTCENAWLCVYVRMKERKGGNPFSTVGLVL